MGSALLLGLGLIACGQGVLPQLAAPPVDMAARVEAADVEENAPVELVLELWSSEGWELVPPVPAAEGLEVAAAGQEGPYVSGERAQTLLRYTLTGPPGSYVIHPGMGQATGPGDETRSFELAPIFVDVGVEGPQGGEMSGLVLAPSAHTPGWVWVGAGLGALAVAGLVFWTLRRRQPAPLPPPPPPHEVALAEWSRVMAQDLDDHERALALSRIFRVYLGAVFGVPAMAATTRELLGLLGAGACMDPADQVRAAHILDATDRLKFARLGGGEAFFAELDGDFRLVVQATRHHPTRALVDA